MVDVVVKGILNLSIILNTTGTARDSKILDPQARSFGTRI